MNKITIAIPVYNSEQYLKRCLDTVFQQLFTDFEVIIVNDSSPNNHSDKSIDQIIQSYDTHDTKKITVINHEQNKGLFQARLSALRIAKTEYICFIDSDDWLEKTYLESLYKSIIQNDSHIAVSGFYYSKSNKNRIKSSANLTNKKTIVSNNDDVTNLIFRQEIRHCIWNKLYKRELLIDSNLLHISSVINQSEDLLFNSYAFFNAKKVSIIKEPLYNYFLNNASMTNNFSLKTFTNRIDSINMVMSHVEDLITEKNAHNMLNDDLKKRYIQQSYYLISIIQRANLDEDLYTQAFEYMLDNIKHEYVIKSLKQSPVFKIANIIENKLLPPLTLRRYWVQLIHNKVIKILRRKK